MTEPDAPPPLEPRPAHEQGAEPQVPPDLQQVALPSCVGEPVLAPVPPPNLGEAPWPGHGAVESPVPALVPLLGPVGSASDAAPPAHRAPAVPPLVPSAAAHLGSSAPAPEPPREPARSAPMPPLFTPPPREPKPIPVEPEPPIWPPGPPPPAGPPPDVTGAGFGPGPERRPSHEGWALAMHLSAVLTLGFAWLLIGFLGPLILWLAKKDDDPELDWHGREALNFQLNLLLFWLAGLPLLLLCCVGLLVWAVLPFYGIVLGLIATIKAADGKRWRYPLTLRLLND